MLYQFDPRYSGVNAMGQLAWPRNVSLEKYYENQTPAGSLAKPRVRRK